MTAKNKDFAVQSQQRMESRPRAGRIGHGTLLGLFTAKVTMRRSALLLGVNRITVRRKLIHLGKIARAQDQIPSSLKCKHFIFDEVITKETSKFLPLAIHLLVAHPSRVIMDFDVAAMTAQERFRAEGEARYGTRGQADQYLRNT